MALRRVFFGGLTALLVVLSSPTEAKKKAKVEKPAETQNVSQPFYGSRQEYVATQSGDQYVFFCWGPIAGLNDKEVFAMLRSISPPEGQQCIDHFYFKEGDSYCSFEHSKRKEGSRALNQEALVTDEAYAFDFAPPVREIYALYCTSPLEASDLPYSVEGRRDVVFKDSIGKVCVFMGMQEEGKKQEKIENSNNKNKK